MEKKTLKNQNKTLSRDFIQNSDTKKAHLENSVSSVFSAKRGNVNIFFSKRRNKRIVSE